MKYRKKPVIVEAFRWGYDQEPDWYKEAVNKGSVFEQKHYEHPYCVIKTLEGNHGCSYGDYIIKGVKGELYPCKPDIFEMTYERVEE